MPDQAPDKDQKTAPDASTAGAPDAETEVTASAVPPALRAPSTAGATASASAANGSVDGAPTLDESSKKKSRLQWDEDNLISNAQEMERAGPRMKIDEPKTPYVQGSETGSSTSGSAHQSPPESPSFIPREQLVGFRSLEASMRRGSGASSDGASSGGSAGRSVHISDDFAHSSGGSSPRSKELFAARRKAHYRNEAARLGHRVLRALDKDDSDSDDSEKDSDAENRPNGHQNGTEETNGSVAHPSSSVRARLAMLNGQSDDKDGAHSTSDDGD